MPTADEFIEAARQYKGVKWMHQGRNKAGIDCIGLIVRALSDIGLEKPDLTGYKRTPVPNIFMGHIHEHSDPLLFPEPGAIGVFRGVRDPCHVGIFAEMYGRISLIHAYAGQRVVMEEPFDHDWPRLLLEVRKVKGLQY